MYYFQNCNLFSLILQWMIQITFKSVSYAFIALDSSIIKIMVNGLNLGYQLFI